MWQEKAGPDWLEINMIMLGRRRCRTTCRRERVSLKSPAADRHNTIRLYIVFFFSTLLLPI